MLCSLLIPLLYAQTQGTDWPVVRTISPLVQGVEYIIESGFLLDDIPSARSRPSDAHERHRIFLQLRHVIDARPMRHILSALVSEDLGEIIDRRDSRYWDRLSLTLRRVSVLRLRSLINMQLSDLDLHMGAAAKLRVALGESLALDLLRSAGQRAVVRLNEIGAGWVTRSSSENRNAFKEFCGQADGCWVSADVSALAGQAAESADAILKYSSVQVHRNLVSMVNEDVLRFAIGAVRAAELLLREGMQVLIDNMSDGVRIMRPFSDQLVAPMQALRSLAGELNQDSDALIWNPIFRPRFSHHLEFLVGPQRTKQLMRLFPKAYAKSLAAAGLSIRPARYLETLWPLLKKNVLSHQDTFWCISLSNDDRLAAVVGLERTRWLLTKRGYMILGRLGMGPAHTEWSPRDRSFDVLAKAHGILNQLRDYAHLFPKDRVMELAFFVGTGPADVLTTKGFHTKMTVFYANKNRKPQITAAIDLFDPPQALLRPIMSEAILKELENINEDQLPLIRL